MHASCRSPSRGARPPARSVRTRRSRSSCDARPGRASSAVPRSTGVRRAGTARPRPPAAPPPSAARTRCRPSSRSARRACSWPGPLRPCTRRRRCCRSPTAWFATIFSCGPAAASSSASTFSVSIVIERVASGDDLQQLLAGDAELVLVDRDVAALAEPRERLVHDRAGDQDVRLVRSSSAPSRGRESGVCHDGPARASPAARPGHATMRAVTSTLETERLRLRPLRDRRRRRR